MSLWHLAQLNIARSRAPLDSPALADFVAALAPINALAEQSPGFVWRLQSPAGNSMAVRMLDDERLIVNLTVWESLETLRAFVYRGAHTEVMRQRRKWFESMLEAYAVLWWLPAGRVPTVEEAEQKLTLLRREGPSPEAFTFKQSYPAPSAPSG